MNLYIYIYINFILWTIYYIDQFNEYRDALDEYLFFIVFFIL